MTRRLVVHNHFPAKDAEKYSHEEVDYGKSTGKDYCAACVHFRDDPVRCELVKNIARDGWCRLFKRA